MKKSELQYFTWKEIKEIYSENPVILIPLGSMEEHGPHSITGDYIAAYEIAKRISEKSNAFTLPVIPFGHSEYFRGFSGTISLSLKTMHLLCKDILMSLLEHGVNKIVFINGHSGNSPIIDNVAREVKREHGVMIGKIDLWRSLSQSFKDELYGKGVNPMGHGGEPITSVMKYLCPEHIKMNLLEEKDQKSSWQAMQVGGLSQVKIDDITTSIYFDMEDLSEQGVLGDPYIGNSEIGEKIINKLVQYGVKFVEQMINTNTVINKMKGE
ncbi:MAG: creatininase family protein [Maledivibacter sp.]|jgi:creatinine amidohydrolase|nr:creatininase family protein [Maledivibacter sp.]